MMVQLKVTSHLVILCIVISFSVSTHAIRPVTAGVGSLLSVAYAVSNPEAFNIGVTIAPDACVIAATAASVISAILYRMTPCFRLDCADGKLSLVHELVRDPNFLAKIESPDDKKALFDTFDHRFAHHAMPYVCATQVLLDSINCIRDAQNLAQKAASDINKDDKWLSERCVEILKKSKLYDDKAVMFLEIIRNHPDYNTQMTNHAERAAVAFLAANAFYHPGR